MKVTNDHIRSDNLMEWMQTGSVNGNCKFDKSDRDVLENQRDISNNEVIKNVTESMRYELAEEKAAIKYVEHVVNVTKNIIDQHPAKPKDYEEWTDEERYEFIMANNKIYFPSIPESLMFFIRAAKHRGDCGRSSTEKPHWLDMEKFRRGQKLMQDYMPSFFVANLVSLFGIFAFEDGLKPLILSRQSHTPYLAFKRYVSTVRRITNWMTEDPWTKGTTAHRGIQVVRRMHRAIRLKLCEYSNEEIDAACKMLNPQCPDRKMILDDFSSCPYASVEKGCLHLSIKPTGFNQADMAATQFAFVGLIVLYPHEFGIHLSDEDLETFCHVWRSIGYLLGMKDEFNYCSGSLEEIKQQTRDFINIWMKPYFRQVTPEWEHMMRCIVDGFGTAGLNHVMEFKVLLLFFAKILDIDMPQTRSTLTYLQRLQFTLIRFTFRYAMRLRFIRNYFNKRLTTSIEKFTKIDPEKFKGFTCPEFSSQLR